jgi:hypothetical protein
MLFERPNPCPPQEMMKGDIMAQKKSALEEITLTGIINTIEDEDVDDITAVELSTDDMDYLIEPDGLGKELFDYIGDEVEVVGTVIKINGEKGHIRVSRYEVLDDYDDEDYEDEDEFDYDDDEDDDEDFDDDDDFFDDDDDDD